MRRHRRLSKVQPSASPVPVVHANPQRARLTAAVQAAYKAGAGVPVELEEPTRAFARAAHGAGVPVEKVIIEIKELLRTETADHALVFVPRVVGWAVAGYFHGVTVAGPS